MWTLQEHFLRLRKERNWQRNKRCGGVRPMASIPWYCQNVNSKEVQSNLLLVAYFKIWMKDFVFIWQLWHHRENKTGNIHTLCICHKQWESSEAFYASCMTVFAFLKDQPTSGDGTRIGKATSPLQIKLGQKKQFLQNKMCKIYAKYILNVKSSRFDAWFVWSQEGNIEWIPGYIFQSWDYGTFI